MSYQPSGAAAFALLALLASPLALAQDCELDRPVMFAGLDWDSNRVHNAIARHIIEEGYGCRTDAIPGSTIPLLAGMVGGNIDVTMEIWAENISEAWNEALEAGQVKEVGINYPDAAQGWYVPRYVVEGDPERGIEPMAPELRAVSDLPRYKDLFRDPEVPDKGRFYNCILGWQCEVHNTKKLEVYGLTDDYTNFRPGTGAALSAAIASAYKRGQPILSYYWSPTWVLGVYDMIKLKEPAFDQETWENFLADEDPEAAVAYPQIEVLVGANSRFYDRAPQLIEFLDRYQTTSDLVSELLAYMQDNNASEQQAALHFLRTRPEIWYNWVPEEVARRVEDSL
ncbi:MAG: ABC transporter substrate-binding protein [Candidatus Competibacteraceae bacterium]|nr:ABC transporter substrate-binding protein [Candidatus Competibacteraceae bacterium]